MSTSYILGKKPQIKKLLLISVIVLALSIIAVRLIIHFNFFTAMGSAIYSVAFALIFVTLFVSAGTFFMLLILRILLAVGYWDK